jgi:superfamily II DNA or RNA helicase
MGTPALRNWQVEAIDAVRTLWRDDPDAKPLVAVCPGAGKTRLGAELAKQLLKEGKIRGCVILCPGTNIQRQWVEQCEAVGLKATDRADNAAIRWRQKFGHEWIEDYDVLVVNYYQLAKDPELFELLAKMVVVLVIADEIHHADDEATFGRAVSLLAEAAGLRLALSGTPFNSTGGALAMCDHEDIFDDEGRAIRRTIPVYQYSYSDALSNKVCRPVEFIKTMGKSKTIYLSLDDRSEWERVIDLNKKLKTDSLVTLLDADGAFMEEMIRQALKALTEIKRLDARSAMLVVVKDTAHGNAVTKRISRICHNNPDWSSYTTQEIYNDTEKAHEKIKELRHDRTDIVVSVRMLSEGVDIKRLRVGLYATDYLTRMFFQQFVGRFTRYDDRLDESQHARIIIPGHIMLLRYAREIELMVLDALIPLPGIDGGGGDRKNEILGNTTEADQTGLVYRGEETDDTNLAAAFLEKYPALRGLHPDSVVISFARAVGIGPTDWSNDRSPPKRDWSYLNERVAQRIVRLLKVNAQQQGQEIPNDNLFKKINSMANKAVGIQKKDHLTPEDILEQRHAWLMNYMKHIIGDDGSPDGDSFA